MAESARSAYHLRRAATLSRRLRFEEEWLTSAERGTLLARIAHHTAKAKELADA